MGFDQADGVRNARLQVCRLTGRCSEAPTSTAIESRNMITGFYSDGSDGIRDGPEAGSFIYLVAELTPSWRTRCCLSCSPRSAPRRVHLRCPPTCNAKDYRHEGPLLRLCAERNMRSRHTAGFGPQLEWRWVIRARLEAVRHMPGVCLTVQSCVRRSSWRGRRGAAATHLGT